MFLPPAKQFFLCPCANRSLFSVMPAALSTGKTRNRRPDNFGNWPTSRGQPRSDAIYGDEYNGAPKRMNRSAGNEPTLGQKRIMFAIPDPSRTECPARARQKSSGTCQYVFTGDDVPNPSIQPFGLQIAWPTQPTLECLLGIQAPLGTLLALAASDQTGATTLRPQASH